MIGRPLIYQSLIISIVPNTVAPAAGALFSRPQGAGRISGALRGVW